RLYVFCLFLFSPFFSLFFFNSPASTELYTLSLHDALPISGLVLFLAHAAQFVAHQQDSPAGDGNVRHVERRKIPTIPIKQQKIRSEEHTSELQSRENLVCRLLLEKKKTRIERYLHTTNVYT